MSDEGASAPRVLVVGYDGADWQLVEQFTRAGKLPVLASLMARGSAGPLRSVIPVLSPAAWASFATGVMPGKHGIFDFEHRAEGDYRLRLVTARDMRGPAFWDTASRAGKRTAVVNVPLTYPPSPVNGVMITGLGTPDQATFTWPADLSEELRAQGYRVNKTVFFGPGREDAYLRDTYDLIDRQGATALNLFRQEPWDLFVVVFRDLDEVSHYFWKHMDASHPKHDPAVDGRYQDVILSFYQHLDAKLGQFLEAAGPGVNVLVLSDHGFGPLYKDVFLNEWLKREGFLFTTQVHRPLVQRALMAAGLTRNRVSRLLQSAGLSRLERRIRRALGKQLTAIPAHDRATFPDAVDWTRSRCYSYGYHGQIFVNLKGREPHGIVAEGAEYEAVLAELEAKLAALRDPEDGRPVVTRVIRGTKLFGDAVQRGAPDLVLLMRDLSYITRQGYEFGGEAGSIFAEPASYETGSHREIGVALLAGPAVEHRPWQEPVSIADLAPTLLSILRLSPPEGLDGRVLHELLRAGECGPLAPAATAPAAQRDERPADAGLSEEEEREMRDRLRKLGYLG